MSTSFAQQPKCYNLSENECTELLAQIMEYANKETNFSGSRRVLAKKPLILKYKKQIILASIGAAAATTGGLLLANYNDTVRNWCQEAPLLNLFIWNKKINNQETTKNNDADSNKQKNSNPKNTKLDEKKETLIESAQKEIDHLNAKKDLSKEEQKALLQNQLKIKNNEVLELAKQHKQKTIETEEFNKQKKLLLSEVSNLKEQITLLSNDT